MVPYSRTTSAVVTSGTKLCVTLPAPTRGILNRLIVKQNSGAIEGFSVDLFDRRDACESVAIDSSNPDDNVSYTDPFIHKVIPTQTVETDVDVLELHEKVWGYLNQDERNPNSMRATGALYLEIDAAGSGDKGFFVGYTVTVPELT